MTWFRSTRRATSGAQIVRAADDRIENRLDLANISPAYRTWPSSRRPIIAKSRDVTLQRQDDVFPGPVVVFAAKTRRDVRVAQTVRYRVQMVVRRSDQQVFEVVSASFVFDGGTDAFKAIATSVTGTSSPCTSASTRAKSRMYAAVAAAVR
jgi:hypothetical protein